MACGSWFKNLSFSSFKFAHVDAQQRTVNAQIRSKTNRILNHAHKTNHNQIKTKMHSNASNINPL